LADIPDIVARVRAGAARLTVLARRPYGAPVTEAGSYGRERRFGELTEPAEERLTYGSYLQIPELLALQRVRSEPAVHDELLFIVVHQAYELWFKQLLFELGSIRDRMFAGDAERARHYLVRVRAIERVMIEHIDVLRSMSPQDFLEFRTQLTPASGFQSAQFRELEFLSGLKDPRFLVDLASSDEERIRLERRLGEPTLWDGFRALMDDRGFPMPGDDEDRRTASLVAMAVGDRELFAVSEGLLDHDEAVAEWRYRHVLMVEREIGAKRGTGGSSGVGYLRSTLDKRFFPELWDLRSHL
jgi:tryptophan 2,3-dioxygenase